MPTNHPRSVLLVRLVALVETRLLHVPSAVQANLVDREVIHVFLVMKAFSVRLVHLHVQSVVPVNSRVVTMISAFLVPPDDM